MAGNGFFLLASCFLYPGLWPLQQQGTNKAPSVSPSSYFSFIQKEKGKILGGAGAWNAHAHISRCGARMLEAVKQVEAPVSWENMILFATCLPVPPRCLSCQPSGSQMNPCWSCNHRDSYRATNRMDDEEEGLPVECPSLWLLARSVICSVEQWQYSQWLFPLKTKPTNAWLKRNHNCSMSH